jgi:hypothetical protein
MIALHLCTYYIKVPILNKNNKTYILGVYFWQCVLNIINKVNCIILCKYGFLHRNSFLSSLLHKNFTTYFYLSIGGNKMINWGAVAVPRKASVLRQLSFVIELMPTWNQCTQFKRLLRTKSSLARKNQNDMSRYSWSHNTRQNISKGNKLTNYIQRKRVWYI